MYKLKIYRRVLCHDNEEWCKIWRGIDLLVQNWHEEFGEFWSEDSKISKIYTLMGFFWTMFIMFELKKVEKCMKTQSRKCTSLKFTGEVCFTTVEALRKRLSAKWKKTSRFWIVDVTYLITEQLNWSHTQFLCAWIGHVHSAYMRNIKEAIITVITRG